MNEATAGQLTIYGVIQDVPEQATIENLTAPWVVTLIATLLPLISVFQFRKRKLQVLLGNITIIANLGILALAYLVINRLNASLPGISVSYSTGILFPVIAIVFLILANGAIRKDERLVRSADRLR